MLLILALLIQQFGCVWSGETVFHTISIPEAGQLTHDVHWIKHWSDGVVPYTFTERIPEFEKYFYKAVRHIEKHSCVRFVKTIDSVDEPYTLTIFPSPDSADCSATLGRKENARFELGCDYATILRNLLKVLGIPKEYRRFDRDRFVDDISAINPENLAHVHQREIFTPYDVHSILNNIGEQSTTRNHGKGEFFRKSPNIYLSTFDKIKINKVYKCGESEPACIDRNENCALYGLGKFSETYWDPKNAQCKSEEWATKFCAKTCGQCYKFIKSMSTVPHWGPKNEIDTEVDLEGGNGCKPVSVYIPPVEPNENEEGEELETKVGDAEFD